MESQLLVERKLARQHVDTKIVEQQIKCQQEEQNKAPIRQVLGSRPLGSLKNVNDPTSALSKDQANSIQPLVEKNNYKPQLPFHPMDEFVKYIDSTEKENNPDTVEQSFLPKRTGRASICPMARRMSAVPAPRRNSLIPFPSTPNHAQLPLQFLPLAPIPADNKDDIDESEANCLPNQTSCDSPKVIKTGNRKLSSILRKSLQKRNQTKSPMHQHIKKGVNVGMEKVRVSIGSRGRLAQRVLLINGRRPGTKGMQKQSQKEKERGWNVGTVGRG